MCVEYPSSENDQNARIYSLLASEYHGPLGFFLGLDKLVIRAGKGTQLHYLSEITHTVEFYLG